MVKFCLIIDNNLVVKLNCYYMVIGISWGLIFFVLFMGGLYLLLYGLNDGLVNEWSVKLLYGIYLFIDFRFDYDNIRKGLVVFVWIELYLCMINVGLLVLVVFSISLNENLE